MTAIVKKLAISEPGIYDMPDEAYHADPCAEMSLSSSGAALMDQACPSVYKYERDNPPEKTPALLQGNAVHARVLLGAEAFHAIYAVQPEDMSLSTKAGIAFKKQCAADGMTIIKYKAYEEISGMADRLEAHPIASKMFSGGKPEQTLIWRDAEFGVWCRAKLDYLPSSGDVFGDYKSTLSAHPRDIEKHIWNYNYFQRAAWYLSGLKHLGLARHPKFHLIFQEKRAPHEIVVTSFDQEDLVWGHMINRKSMEIFAKAVKTGFWPGYTKQDEVVTVSLPRFARFQLDDRFNEGAFEISMAYHKPLEEKS